MRYWRWLAEKYPEDIAQSIALALLSVEGPKPSQEFSRELTRQLNSLARDLGWARSRYKPGPDQSQRVWQKREGSIYDVTQEGRFILY